MYEQDNDNEPTVLPPLSEERKEQMREDDIRWLIWAMGVFAFFCVTWFILPFTISGMLVGLSTTESAVIGGVVFALLTAGAFLLYLPTAEFPDETQMEITHRQAWKDLTKIAIWPVYVVIPTSQQR